MKSLLIILSLATSPLFANYQGHPGNSCQFNNNANASTYNALGGVYNGSNQNQSVHCPFVVIGYNDFSQYFHVTYLKRNQGSFYCRAVVSFLDGTTSYGKNKYACATAGGCLANADNYVANKDNFLTIELSFA